MYNHARTLLLNEDGKKQPGQDFLGEELVPRDYRKLQLPDYIRQIRAFLFGTTPDRAMLNYRIKQFLDLIQPTELNSFVLDLDPRVTYDIADEPTLVRDVPFFVPEVRQYAGTPATLTILGSPAVPDATGRVIYDFDVDILLGNTIEVKRLSQPDESNIVALTLTNGLSNHINLPGTGYRFVVNDDNPGAAWKITGNLRPMWTMGQIVLLLERLGEPTVLELFGLQNVEPWNTFRNLWFDHPELPYKLGGFLLAMIYRTEEVRRLGQS